MTVLPRTQVQRAGTAAQWAASVRVLMAGEIGVQLGNPNKFKIGDGVSLWAALPFEGGQLTNLGQVVVSAATVTPDADSDYHVTILAQAVPLLLANPIGTPLNGQKLVIRLTDDGVTIPITYGSQYRAMGSVLPADTIAGKTMYLGLIYDEADIKWDLVAVTQET